MTKHIRVLQVIGSMNRGGAEAMIMNLYRNIDRDKVQFDFIENTMEKAAFDDEILSLGGKIYNCPHFVGSNFFEYKKWWKDFFAEHEGEYQVIHGHIGSTAAIYLKEAQKAGLYTIAHSHNAGTEKNLRGLLYSAISHPTRNIADYFFACSDAAGIDRFGDKIALSENYTVFHNAIDTEQYKYDEAIRKEVRAELGLNNEFVIGNIGRFELQKNHDFLIEIFYEILKKNDNAKLVLIGDGSLRKAIAEKVEGFGIGESVIFTGLRSDVNRLVQALDLFLMPSFYEGLPVTLVEAQTSGLPCVISDGVPSESILTKNLVTVMGLKDSAEEWAKHILDRIYEERTDGRKEIIEAGFDISETSKWLEAFYLEKSK